MTGNTIGFIYKAENLINGKVYIGQTENFNRRIKEHKNNSFNENSVNYTSYFHNAIRKYGSTAFTFNIIWSGSTTLLNDMEIKYINNYNSLASHNTGYNLTIGGEGVKGYKHTEARKEKISRKMSGRSVSVETRKKISESLKGKKKSDVHKTNLSNVRKGYKHTNDAKQNISDGHKGLKKSEETRKKIGLKHKGKIGLVGNVNPKYDKILYDFINDNGEKFTGTQYDFKTKYGIYRSFMYRLRKGYSINGWKLN
ncbi:MAG TPA: NUMOD3 domain-containing DNA-binding protein [Candidatus Dojkabacteria bacterium]|nr:NUMOD3 domain-containing DNA-binding protein [Candidatus Dojkabacteria bacterium]